MPSLNAKIDHLSKYAMMCGSSKLSLFGRSDFAPGEYVTSILHFL